MKKRKLPIRFPLKPIFSGCFDQFWHIFFPNSQTWPWGHLQVVTCIKRQLLSCPVIWIEPLLKGHLSYKATCSLSQSWPLNTVLTVVSKIKRKSAYQRKTFFSVYRYNGYCCIVYKLLNIFVGCIQFKYWSKSHTNDKSIWKSTFKAIETSMRAPGAS